MTSRPRQALAWLAPLAVLLASVPFCGLAGEAVKLAVYLPTPLPVVRRMLQLGELRRGELHYDLGSGDGRLVIMAATEFDARSIGFEIDPDLIRASRAHIYRLALGNRARIEHEDLLVADFSKPDVITAYLTPEALVQVQPRLARHARHGTRIVSYKFELPGWKPEKTLTWEDPNPSIPTHVIYLYRR